MPRSWPSRRAPRSRARGKPLKQQQRRAPGARPAPSTAQRSDGQRQRAAAHRPPRRAAQRRAAARRAAAPSTVQRRVQRRLQLRPAGGWRNAPIVTWYGPGFYGNRTACGVTYTRTIVGVAHKTLPCGTLVRFQWHGMTAVAPVIDRGPYASAAYVFDFSAALSCNVFRPEGRQQLLLHAPRREVPGGRQGQPQAVSRQPTATERRTTSAGGRATTARHDP